MKPLGGVLREPKEDDPNHDRDRGHERRQHLEKPWETGEPGFNTRLNLPPNNESKPPRRCQAGRCNLHYSALLITGRSERT